MTNATTQDISFIGLRKWRNVMAIECNNLTTSATNTNVLLHARITGPVVNNKLWCPQNDILETVTFPTVCINVLASNQLDVLFHVFIYFISLHVSSITVLIIRRSNCINTSSGMINLCKWLLRMPVLTGIPSSHLHRLIIPDDVLIQFDLLTMSTVMLETCREMK